MPERRSFDNVLLAAVILLCLFGVIMVYSSSAILATVEASSQTAYLRAMLPKLLLGILSLGILSRIPYHRLKGFAPIALWGAVVALLLLLLPVGLATAGRGTKRFLDLGLVAIQPAEFARLALVLFIAAQAAKHEAWAKAGWKGLGVSLAAIFGLAGLVVLQPNLSSASLIVVLGFGLLFLGGQPLYRIAVSALPAVLLPAVLQPYQLARIKAFMLHGGGEGPLPYQLEQSLIALGSGGVLGKGLGEGLQKYFYLPFPHTDFILGVVGEELGFMGIFVLYLLFGIVIYRGMRIARRARDPFSQLLAAGLTLSIALNVVLHSVVVFGLGPVTGVPLPFISHGGTSLLANLTAIGVLLSISRSIRPEPARFSHASWMERSSRVS